MNVYVGAKRHVYVTDRFTAQLKLATVSRALHIGLWRRSCFADVSEAASWRTVPIVTISKMSSRRRYQPSTEMVSRVYEATASGPLRQGLAMLADVMVCGPDPTVA